MCEKRKDYESPVFTLTAIDYDVFMISSWIDIENGNDNVADDMFVNEG